MGNEQGKPGSSGAMGKRRISSFMQRKLAGGVDFNLKVLVRGERGTGKTALIRRLQGETKLKQGDAENPYVPDYEPTSEIQVSTINCKFLFVTHRSYVFQLNPRLQLFQGHIRTKNRPSKWKFGMLLTRADRVLSMQRLCRPLLPPQLQVKHSTSRIRPQERTSSASSTRARSMYTRSVQANALSSYCFIALLLLHISLLLSFHLHFSDRDLLQRQNLACARLRFYARLAEKEHI